ncbi:MAG TPA: serine protease, partial [Longimicrobiaceae bacterium]|nr:serine protease [Longimicrobiaceae bacterium]
MHNPAARPRGILRRLRVGILLAAAMGAGPLAAQEGRTATPAVFQRYAERVVKIQVVESGSAARATTGSGFFVSAGGHLVTNYHVVSQLVHDPGRYRAELVDGSGRTHPVSVLAIDAVHDLAVLRTGVRPPRHFP